MAKNKNNKTNKNIQSEIQVKRVKLPTILGIKPGMYLLGLYSVLILLILFFTLFYPGLSNHGSIYTFKSTPPGASVYVDDIRVGSTPIDSFVTAGEHTITMKKPYFEDTVIADTAAGGVFATIFFPSRKTIDESLTFTDVEGYLQNAVNDFSLWSLSKASAGENETPYYAPNIPETSVRDLLSASNGPSKEKIQAFLIAALGFVNSEKTLSEWISGWKLLNSIEEKDNTSSDITAVFTSLSTYFKEYPYLGFIFYTYASEEERKQLESLELYKSLVNNYTASISDKNITIESEADRNDMAGQELFFEAIPGGSFLMGLENTPGDFPHYVEVGPFYMTNTEITNSQFHTFIQNNRKWRAGNKSELIAQGLVDEGYLAHWNGDTYPEREADYPVRNVSWYAAKAFAEWSNGDLPTEYQWEWAATAGKDDEIKHNFSSSGGVVVKAESGTPNSFGLYNLMGNLWEWCDDPFSESGFLGYSTDNSLVFDDFADSVTTKAVRGGCWGNRDYDIKLTTRGSYPASWCTPFTGFRVVLEDKNE